MQVGREVGLRVEVEPAPVACGGCPLGQELAVEPRRLTPDDRREPRRGQRPQRDSRPIQLAEQRIGQTTGRGVGDRLVRVEVIALRRVVRAEEAGQELGPVRGHDRVSRRPAGVQLVQPGEDDAGLGSVQVAAGRARGPAAGGPRGRGPGPARGQPGRTTCRGPARAPSPPGARPAAGPRRRPVRPTADPGRRARRSGRPTPRRSRPAPTGAARRRPGRGGQRSRHRAGRRFDHLRGAGLFDSSANTSGRVRWLTRRRAPRRRPTAAARRETAQTDPRRQPPAGPVHVAWYRTHVRYVKLCECPRPRVTTRWAGCRGGRRRLDRRPIARLVVRRSGHHVVRQGTTVSRHGAGTANGSAPGPARVLASQPAGCARPSTRARTCPPCPLTRVWPSGRTPVSSRVTPGIRSGSMPWPTCAGSPEQWPRPQ